MTADMDRLREAVRILVDEGRPLKDRLNRLLVCSPDLSPT